MSQMKQILEAVVSYFISDSDVAKSAVNRLSSGLEKSGSVSYKLGAVAGSLGKWLETNEFSDDDQMGAEALVEFAKYFATLAKESAPKATAKAEAPARKTAKIAKPKPQIDRELTELVDTAHEIIANPKLLKVLARELELGRTIGR